MESIEDEPPAISSRIPAMKPSYTMKKSIGAFPKSNSKKFNLMKNLNQDSSKINSTNSTFTVSFNKDKDRSMGKKNILTNQRPIKARSHQSKEIIKSQKQYNTTNWKAPPANAIKSRVPIIGIGKNSHTDRIIINFDNVEHYKTDIGQIIHEERHRIQFSSKMVKKKIL